MFINRYLRLFRELGGEALEGRARAVMPEKRILDPWSYPYRYAVDMALAVVDELAPRYGSVDAWLFEIGRMSTESYLGSVLGRFFLASFRPAPDTLLAQMPRAINSMLSFGQRTVTFPTPTSALFQCRNDFSAAPSNAGAVHGALQAVGARSPRVDIKYDDLLNHTLIINWTER